MRPKSKLCVKGLVNLGAWGVVQEQKGACGWTKAVRNLVRICDLPVGQNKDQPFEALVSLFQALKMRARLFYIQHMLIWRPGVVKLPYISYIGGCVSGRPCQSDSFPGVPMRMWALGSRGHRSCARTAGV